MEKDPLQSVIDLALDQNWGNTATTVIKAKIPKGTTINEGFAAPQTGKVKQFEKLIGGGSQVYIPRVNPDWVIK